MNLDPMPLRNTNAQLLLIALSYKVVVLFSLYFVSGGSFSDLLNWGDIHSYIKIAQSFPLPYADGSMLNDVKHYPLYPFAVFIVNGIFNNIVFSAFFTVIASSSVAVVVFYNIAKGYSKNAFPLAILFACLPPKWVQISVFPWSEPIFILLLLLSVLLFLKERYRLAYTVLGLLLVARPLGVLFLFSFFLYDVVLQRRFRHLPYIVMAVIPFLLFHLYLYSIFGKVLLFAHTPGWGGQIFSYPLAGFIEGMRDETFIPLRKIYTLGVFVAYSIVFVSAGYYLRRKEFLLVSLIVIPYFLFTLFLKGETVNWWMVSLPRFLVPLAPFGVLLVLRNLPARYCYALIAVSSMVGIAYTIGSHFLHAKYGGIV